jgi:hypothetical protein
MKNRTLWLGLIFATSLAVQGPTQADENRGTLEQQLACTPDVFRLCGSEMPDVNRLVASLATPAGRCSRRKTVSQTSRRRTKRASR